MRIIRIPEVINLLWLLVLFLSLSVVITVRADARSGEGRRKENEEKGTEFGKRFFCSRFLCPFIFLSHPPSFLPSFLLALIRQCSHGIVGNADFLNTVMRK